MVTSAREIDALVDRRIHEILEGLVDRRIHEILEARGLDSLDTAVIMAKTRKDQATRDRTVYSVTIFVLLGMIGGMATAFVQMVKIWWEYVKKN